MPRTLTEGVGEQRDPRPVRRAGADPATTVVRSGQALAPDFTCPVCLRILRKTEIVVECLHRFCGECIQKCLRVAKHECPSCRVKVPSRRSLKRDAAFDALIATVYPDLDAYERGDELCLPPSVREGLDRVLQLRPSAKRLKQPSPAL